MKLPLISGEEMCEIASKLVLRCSGNEEAYHMVAPRGCTTTIPFHSGKTLPRGLTHKILSDLKITAEGYIKMR